MSPSPVAAFAGFSFLVASLANVPALAPALSQTREKDAANLIRVLEGDGAPVITDGLFSPGEWDDAKWIDLNQVVRLYFKQYGGVVFLGIRGAEANGIGPSALSIAPPAGPIHLLHVSAQLGEVIPKGLPERRFVIDNEKTCGHYGVLLIAGRPHSRKFHPLAL